MAEKDTRLAERDEQLPPCGGGCGRRPTSDTDPAGLVRHALCRL
ncbi:MAG TPA: hypothetical protein VG795_14980 [Acidimicrobiia bacterium]|nr:hypothetical protein [Acidimicrobiia bacterium]